MKKSHTDFLVIIHIRLSEKVEEEEQKRTDPSVLGVLRALPWLLGIGPKLSAQATLTLRWK